MAAARHVKLAMGLNKNALQSTALAHKLGQACMDERSTPLINIDSYGSSSFPTGGKCATVAAGQNSHKQKATGPKGHQKQPEGPQKGPGGSPLGAKV